MSAAMEMPAVRKRFSTVLRRVAGHTTGERS